MTLTGFACESTKYPCHEHPDGVCVREPVPFAEAVAMLPEGPMVHTFRASPGMMLGADWDRQTVIGAMAECGVELAGPMATAMGHKLVLFDPKPLFIEVRGS